LKSDEQYARRVELDHVLIAVADLGEAAQEMHLRHGLCSVEGGRHPAWGTANRIVPLGDSYLELVAVVDPATATTSAFGRWVASGASTTAHPIGWAVRTSQLDEIAQRLDLPVHAGSRTTAAGDELQWRSAGIDEAAAEPSLPFFIQWAPQTVLPGRASVRHPAGAARISRLVLDADPGRLTGWLGAHHLPLVVREGKPAVASIYVSSETVETVIGSVDS
jgi:Glyoxalase-like domain